MKYMSYYLKTSFLCLSIFIASIYFGWGLTIKTLQKGSTNILPGDSTTTVNISKVTLSKAFLSFSMTVNAADPGDFQVGGELSNDTTIVFHRYNGSASYSTAQIEWQVFEFSDTGFNVVSGVTTSYGSSSSFFFSPTVDPAKSFVISSMSTSGVDYSADDGCTANLISFNSLRLEGGASNSKAYWQIIECDSCDVEKITFSLSNTQSIDSVSINPIDMSRTIVLGNHRQNGSVVPSMIPTTELTANNFVKFKRTSTSGNIDFVAYVIQFDTKTKVQHIAVTLDSFEIEKDIIISNVNPNCSEVLLPGNMGRQGSSEYNADDSVGFCWITANLTSYNTIHIKRSSIGARLNIPIQIISFEGCEVTAEAGNDTNICFGDSVILGGSPAADKGIPPYQYNWIPSYAISNDTIANPEVFPSVDTFYILTVTDSIGEEDKDTVWISVSNLVINAGKDSTVSEAIFTLGGSPTATGGTTPYGYNWSKFNDGFTDTTTNPMVTLIVDTNIYILILTDSLLCLKKDTIIIIYIPDENGSETKITIPEAFSPNDDGKNDHFCVAHTGIKEISLSIFNRKGLLLHETFDLTETCWNGKYKNKPVEQDSYLYIIKAISQSNESIIKQGDITLLR